MAVFKCFQTVPEHNLKHEFQTVPALSKTHRYPIIKSGINDVYIVRAFLLLAQKLSIPYNRHKRFLMPHIDNR